MECKNIKSALHWGALFYVERTMPFLKGGFIGKNTNPAYGFTKG
jgi:hypothetical protein